MQSVTPFGPWFKNLYDFTLSATSMAVYPLISIRTRSITPSNFYNLFFIYFTVYLITNQNILRAGIKKKIHGTVCSMKERTTITLSLRSAFFCSNSSIAFALRASRALSSCSLKGQSLGIPGSFSTFFFPYFLFFYSSSPSGNTITLINNSLNFAYTSTVYSSDCIEELDYV